MNLAVFTPDVAISRRERLLVVLAWIALGLLLWQFSNIEFLPKPTEVIHAFERLREQGTFLEFGPSLIVMAESVFWTVVISLSLAYASVVPAMRPLVTFVSGLRYLGLVGLMLAFTLIAPDGHILKVMVLTFGMTVFYLRDMEHVVADIPQEEYDHAKTLGMGSVRMVIEVVVFGTMDKALDSLRVNAAMGWMMLTSVEIVSRSEGGIGVVMSNLNRHMDLPAEAAILLTLLGLGLLQDIAIGAFKDYIACPFARIGRARG